MNLVTHPKLWQIRTVLNNLQADIRSFFSSKPGKAAGCAQAQGGGECRDFSFLSQPDGPTQRARSFLVSEQLNATIRQLLLLTGQDVQKDAQKDAQKVEHL